MCRSFYIGEDTGEGNSSSANRDRIGEDHKAGFTTHKPMMMHRGREPFTQTNGASSNRAFPRGFPRQGAGTDGIDNSVGQGTGNNLDQGAGLRQDRQLSGRIQLGTEQQYRGEQNKPLRIKHTTTQIDVFTIPEPKIFYKSMAH